MDKLDTEFASLIEDALRKFPDEELSLLYEKYTQGEKGLYDLIMKKVSTHLTKIFNTPPPAPKKPFPGPPKESVRDMLSTRKKLDFEIESCIRDSDVYKYTLGTNGGNEEGAYAEAYKYYSGSTPI
jgi:hypothetical protein